MLLESALLMLLLRKFCWFFLLGLMAPSWALAQLVPSATSSGGAVRCNGTDWASRVLRGGPAYVLSDSIGYGLEQDGLEAKLQARLGAPAKISYDAGRSINTPGSQIKKTSFESVDIDHDLIAQASVIIIILGTNQIDASFEKSQIKLMEKLKVIAPQAHYYWVDIGATISTHAAGWSAINKIIYDNAPRLEYHVISRYKAIFGPLADPLNIKAGENFPGWVTEPGYGGPGNLHGGYPELSQAIIKSLDAAMSGVDRGQLTPGATYLIGDSIAYGLHQATIEKKLKEKLGGPTKVSYDAGRSITSPGMQIIKTALESIEIDQAYISKASVIVILLGTNQMETSFADSQVELIKKLKAIAPCADYYWVDIAATISTQAASWSARNKIIYDNAPRLGYQVISRYKAIFGAAADPLNITPGQVFPGLLNEPGYDGPGNIHGAYTELAQAILEAIPAPVPRLSTRNLVLPPAPRADFRSTPPSE